MPSSIELLNRRRRMKTTSYWNVILFFIIILLYKTEGDKLCTTKSPSGRLVFRINETSDGSKPNLVLDLSRDVGESNANVNLELKANPGGYFRLNQLSKQLVLEKPLDRDATNLTMLSLSLTCTYATFDGQSQQGEIGINILVNDINDNAPKFLKSPYFANISRYTPVGALINVTLITMDPDFGDNARIQYRIIPATGYPTNSSEYFIVKDNQMVLKNPLDFEQYNFVVEASDSPVHRVERQVATTGVTVNVFDLDEKPPSFVHPECNRLFGGICSNVDYTISIKAGVMPAIQPLTVQPNPIQARDLEPQNIPVRFSFVNGTPTNYEAYFFIDTQSGAVSQLRAVPLGSPPQFVIVVMATEIGRRNLGSTARLIINVDSTPVNLYPPELQASGTIGYIEENAEMGTTVRIGETAGTAALQILVTDEDLKPGMPPATYQYILTGLGASIFAVNQGGFVYLNLPTLDADGTNPSAYQLTIQAREVGTTPIRSSEPLTLTINVIDTNDNTPVFAAPSYHASVSPGVNQQNIIEVKAVDSDKGKFGQLVHRIVSVTNNGDAFFRYNGDTGYLVAIAPLPANQQYQVLLEATDGGGKSSQIVVVVDVEARSSTKTVPSVPSTSSTGSDKGFVGKVTSSSFTPSVFASSSGSPGFISAEYNVSVSESVQPNSVVMALGGTLTGFVSYAILRGNEDGKFRLDSVSGFLTTASKLDREIRPSYRLYVLITTADANNTIVLNINVVDDNDNSPRIVNNQPIVFQAQENVANGFVGQIVVQDLDVGLSGKITLSIVPANDKFAIDPSDGTIRTLVALNRSETAHRFTVVAKDGGSPPHETNAQVTVNVVDSIVQLPFFPISLYNVSINENEGKKEILRVQAVHPASSSASITYELRQGDPSLFAVDALSGAVSTLSSLDAEQTRSHTLIVGTKENKQPSLNSTATVIVSVLDVNDWVPLFRPFSYTATITDDLPPDTPITQVTAEDNDLTPPNNIVRYQITGFGQARQYFKIDPMSGLISVSKSLQDAPKPDLIVLVEAKDGGVPPLSSTATVAITLQGNGVPNESSLVTSSNGTTVAQPNLNRPIKFSTPSSSASVSEGVSPPYFVQIMSVENKPANRQGIQCNIISGNFANTFSISVNNEGNCELRTQTSLDREQIDQYVLNISVSSPSTTPGGGRSDYTESTIFVIDTNDNPPVFEFEAEGLSRRTYFGALDVNAKEFTSIITVKATDPDSGNNAQVAYSVPTNESDSKYFMITQNGEIKNVKTLSAIKDKANMLFQFRVEARDNPLPGNGISKATVADVVINGITASNRFVMVLEGILPDQAYKYIPDIKRSLINRTGSCRIIGIEAIGESENVATEEKPGTELSMYAIDPASGVICRRDQFSSLFEDGTVRAISGEFDPRFKVQSIKSSAPIVATGGLFSSDKWQAAEIALIVLACVIAVGAIIGILAMCYFWSRYKASRRNVVPIDRMHLYSALPKYNALLLPASEKEYETQMLQMALPDEHDHGRHADADFSIEEGIYTIQAPHRLDMFAQPHPPSHVYIPPPDYPVNGHLNGNFSSHNSLHRYKFTNGEKTTIL